MLWEVKGVASSSPVASEFEVYDFDLFTLITGDELDTVDVEEYFLFFLPLLLGLTRIKGVNTFGAPCLAAMLEFDSAGLPCSGEVLTEIFTVVVILSAKEFFFGGLPLFLFGVGVGCGRTKPCACACAYACACACVCACACACA